MTTVTDDDFGTVNQCVQAGCVCPYGTPHSNLAGDLCTTAASDNKVGCQSCSTDYNGVTFQPRFMRSRGGMN